MSRKRKNPTRVVKIGQKQPEIARNSLNARLPAFFSPCGGACLPAFFSPTAPIVWQAICNNLAGKLSRTASIYIIISSLITRFLEGEDIYALL